jgi:flagellar biosynthetic protein FlhB
MAEETGQEKTQPATGRKRQKAREEGQVARSREVNIVLMLGGVIALLALSGGSWMEAWLPVFQKGLDLNSFGKSDEQFAGVFSFWAWETVKFLAPLFMVCSVLAISGNLVQVGFLLTTKKLVPNLNAINPSSGLKRIFSLHGLTGLLTSLLQMVVIGWITYDTVYPELRNLVSLCDRPFGSVLSFSALVAFKLVLKVWLALAVIAGADLLYQRWSYARDLRMTKQEVKEEFRETEGDPKIRSRIRSLQFDMVRRRMMQEVPKADVVITNPDHVAVALRYDRLKEMAPVVIAKGAGWLCERIKKVARENKVAVVENPPLARLLYHKVPLGREIPIEVYRVVAEVLAYVYRLRGKVKDGAVAR